MNTPKTYKSLLVSALKIGAALSLTSVSAHADVLYFETFAGASEAIQDYNGFAAYKDDGTNLSASTVDPIRVNIANSNFYVFIGSAVANVGNSYALISGASSIDPTAYQNDLTFSFNSYATDVSPTNSEMGWRFLAQVGSTIYASDFISYSTVSSEKSVTVAANVWHAWTGESDLSNGFNIANIAGGSGTPLPAGNISNIGVLASIDDTSVARQRVVLICMSS